MRTDSKHINKLFKTILLCSAFGGFIHLDIYAKEKQNSKIKDDIIQNHLTTVTATDAGSANNYYDANYLTFHRIFNFRNRVAEIITVDGHKDTRENQQPVNIIFDTDMDSDCDDAGALAVLHYYADRKMANILGVIFSSGKNRYGIGVCDAINTYYGRENIPLGQYKRNDIGDPRINYGKAIATNTELFHHNVIDSTEEMISVYKQILKKQPDSSVTIVTVGHPHALYLLMHDKEGLNLVCSKVTKCICMENTGTEPSNGWNFTQNGVAPYVKEILCKWPTPVYFSGYGTTVLTGNRLLPSTPPDNPVREAYRLWNNSLENGRSSWDLITVMFAVEPQLFILETNGQLVINDENKVYWDNRVNNPLHIKVTPDLSDTALANKLEQMIADPPRHGSINKISKIHLSAGTASKNYELGSDLGANAIPGGEWNVALDVFAFTRILQSDLPVAIYPCAGKDGGFIKDQNNTYWRLPDMEFTKQMDPQLRRYLDFAFNRKLQYDFLRAMDTAYLVNINIDQYPNPFHVWESAIWLKATQREIVCTPGEEYFLIKEGNVRKGDRIIKNELRRCNITEIRNDGRFQFLYTDKPSNKEIYYRPDIEENEKAFQKVIPELYISISPNHH